MLSITVTITRTDDSVPFWYDSEYYNDIRENVRNNHYLPAVNDGSLVYFNKIISVNGLELTRFIVFKDEAAKDAYLESFYIAFPDFIENRQQYCDDNSHVMTITEEIN
jgi:hypothetical protein